MISKQFIVIPLLFCFLNLKAQNFVKIDFQDEFQGEIVTLYVNGLKICDKQKIYTNSVTGETGFSILFTKVDSNTYYITQFYPFDSKMPYSKNKIYKEINHISTHETLSVKDLEQKKLWEIKVEIEGRLLLKKQIDISQGGYLGITTFNDKLEEGLFIIQSTTAFYYY
ncbi:hypothetical protein AAG747_16465 [Rapidithrix thailandica]|uniref:Uncharacterized protein n=1 Tax=Rapidithrix thailandica TaxID=413964 RepID=A0AAW9S968_9BACT